MEPMTEERWNTMSKAEQVAYDMETEIRYQLQKMALEEGITVYLDGSDFMVAGGDAQRVQILHLSAAAAVGRWYAAQGGELPSDIAGIVSSVPEEMGKELDEAANYSPIMINLVTSEFVQGEA